MSVRVANRSDWPTRFLEVIAKWVAKRERLGVDDDYEFVVRGTCDSTYCFGRAISDGQKIDFPRRFQPDDGRWPMTIRDRRYRWAQEETYRSRVELLVSLMAHEAHHAAAGHPDNFRKNGRVNRASMEFRCNQAGMAAVEAFRAEWPALRKKIKRGLRRERRQRAAALTDCSVSVADPSRVKRKLAEWRRRHAIAETTLGVYEERLAQEQAERVDSLPGLTEVYLRNKVERWRRRASQARARSKRYWLKARGCEHRLAAASA